MRSTKFLYGVEPEAFINKTYKDAIEFKRDRALKIWLRIRYKKDKTEAEAERMHLVFKAYTHNINLLKEIELTW